MSIKKFLPYVLVLLPLVVLVILQPLGVQLILAQLGQTFGKLGNILTMLGLITFLIIAHEGGHYAAARWAGVRVERFGFGLPFGPTLWEKKIGQTTYCIHAALLGGYVSFPDDNPDSDVPKDSPERFENKPAWPRIVIVSAGVVVNFILGFLIMAIVVGNWGYPGGIKVQEVLKGKTPAVAAGLKANDVISRLNGEMMTSMNIQAFPNTLQQHKGEAVTLEIVRNKKPMEIKVIPDKEGRIGIALEPVHQYTPISNPTEVITLSGTFLKNAIVLNFVALGEVITGKRDLKELSGPIGIVKQGSQAIERNGIADGLLLTALISTILAVMNILPIPMLDGGHLLFILIETLRGGKKMHEKFQEKLTQVCFIALLGFMAFVLFNDVKTHLLGF